MRTTRVLSFLIAAGLVVLMGPSDIWGQKGSKGNRGGDPNSRGSGGPSDPGSGRGMGGPGGFDPSRLFDVFSGGRDYIDADDMIARSSQRDPSAKDKIETFLKEAGITDRKINRDQFTSYMQARMAQRGQGGPGSRGPGGNPADDEERAKGSFARLDRNNDGVIDREEARASDTLSAEFDKWDANHNGTIDLDEYKEYYKARMRYLRGDSGSSRGDGSDSGSEQADEDRRPTVYNYSNLSQIRDLPQWFIQYDTDKDAQVALYEWKSANRPVREFLAMDVNGDGLLTVEEVLRFVRAKSKEGGIQGNNDGSLLPSTGVMGMPGMGGSQGRGQGRGNGMTGGPQQGRGQGPPRGMGGPQGPTPGGNRGSFQPGGNRGQTPGAQTPGGQNPRDKNGKKGPTG